MRRRSADYLLLLMFLATQTRAPLCAEMVSVVREVEIGAPNVLYMDPEFEPKTFQVAFCKNLNRLSLGQIDPATGHFVNHEYTFIDTIAPMFITFNGPEWGYSQHGAAIYYTKLDSHRRYHNFRYLNGKITQLDRGNFNLVTNYPSSNSDDPAAFVMGAYALQTLLDGPTWGMFCESKPAEIKSFTMAKIGKGPRFVPGRQQVTTNVTDLNGTTQLALYDFASNRTVQSTFDADDKDSGFVFPAPELQGEPLYICLVNSGAAIRVYRQRGTTWERFAEIPILSSSYPNLQAFAFRGKTYFSFNRESRALPGSNDIVIASLDGKAMLTVSNPNVAMKRFDPETLVSGEKLFVYYYDLTTRKLFLSVVADK